MVDAAGSRATALVALLVRADAEVHTVVVAAPGTATAAVPPLPGAASGTVVAADALTDAAERIGAVVDRLFLVDLEHPDRCRTAFHAVLGADAVANMGTWRRLEETRELCTVVVVERVGERAEPPGAGWRVEHVVVPRIDVSSSAIRDRLADGRPVDGLVPPQAARYLRDRRIYTPAR